MSSNPKKVIKEDKSDPIKWAQPRTPTPHTIYKPANHPRERDLETYRSTPSLVTGGRV
jgi:hypothetical protein